MTNKIQAENLTRRGVGRPKGSPNKTTVRVKEAFEQAFDQLGGVPALVRWGQEDLGEFYKLYAKLLPVQIAGDKDSPLHTVTRIELVPLTERDADS